MNTGSSGAEPCARRMRFRGTAGFIHHNTPYTPEQGDGEIHTALTPSSSKTTQGHVLTFCKPAELQGRLLSPAVQDIPIWEWGGRSLDRFGCTKPKFCYTPVLLPPFLGYINVQGCPSVCPSQYHPTHSSSQHDQHSPSDNNSASVLTYSKGIVLCPSKGEVMLAGPVWSLCPILGTQTTGAVSAQGWGVESWPCQ